MKYILTVMSLFVLGCFNLFAQPVDLKFKSPLANDTYRVGRTVVISWDTLDTQSNRTFNNTFEFHWAENQAGPWSLLAVGSNLKEFKDANATGAAVGKVSTILPRKNILWIRMQLKSNPTVNVVVGPINVTNPAPSTPDSTITGNITNTVTLKSDKIYGLKGVVFVQSGATLRIEAGTIIYGDPNGLSAICINRGAKIYAKGTAKAPIVMTSGFAPGSRDRGDWGGLIICGTAETNLGEAAIEGGIADDATTKTNAWFGKLNGVSNNEDSSGVVSYVRIEFAGIAASPDNELNGLTSGAVGSRTVYDHIQVSYGGDDSFEWFGGSVNAKHIISYNCIDDDLDTDNGYSGNVQFALVKRFKDIADQSNSEAFESDNDSKSSENKPFTRVTFSNVTVIGPVQDTSWTAGSGESKYNTRFLTSAQIRRNSRMSLFNSVITGWPAGVEMTNQNTVRAADADSTFVRYNDFYGIKNEKKFWYFGSGTTAQGKVDANWLSTPAYGNNYKNGTGNTGDLAGLINAYPANLSDFNPSSMANAGYLTTAKFDAGALTDPFFEKVQYRGAFGTTRWDMPWSEYDPVNKDYQPTSSTPQLTFSTPKANDTYRVGRTVTISWDTLDSKGNRTFNNTYEFQWSESQAGPWSLLAVGSNLKEFKDANATGAAIGKVASILPRKNVIWIKIQLKSDNSISGITGPINITNPAPSTQDSIVTGNISQTVTLSSKKIYGLKGVVFVQSGATLRIEAGTIIYGDPNGLSAICINRGGKIYAKGTANAPIVMTSGFALGSRDRGDWGGLIVCGTAETNLGEAAIEGGIADDATTKTNGWFGKLNGVNNNEDSSGVLSYVRIEFAGIAASPDNELNGLTSGAVGSRTVYDHIQVSYGGDDSFEWFGGTVNGKYLISYNCIDDDFDTDNGFSGKIQYGVSKRFKDIADQSNSESFESDNDSKSSENKPFTRCTFSNMTVIGPVQDTSWTSGTGSGKYNTRFLTAAQIRRNSRMSLFNSVITGWPAGVEMTNQNTVRAADADSVFVRYNDFYGIKNEKKFWYFGSGTTALGKVDANWLSTPAYGNNFKNGNGNTGDLAGLINAFPATLPEFNPVSTVNASYLTTAKFDVGPVNDNFFDKVPYRGAFGSQRWDLPWAEYDPVNKDYHATGVEEELSLINKITISANPLPAMDMTTISYSINAEETISIGLIDATGNLLSNFINNEKQSIGMYSFNLNTSGLSSGLYFLRIISEKGIFTKLIPVVK